MAERRASRYLFPAFQRLVTSWYTGTHQYISHKRASLDSEVENRSSESGPFVTLSWIKGGKDPGLDGFHAQGEAFLCPRRSSLQTEFSWAIAPGETESGGKPGLRKGGPQRTGFLEDSNIKRLTTSRREDTVGFHTWEGVCAPGI